MHTAIQARRDGLADLRARATLATADFYAKIGLAAPASAPRFQAANKGNMWHIIDRKTGKTCGFCGSYLAAQQFVDAMEAAATRKLVGRQ
jgi:hypothetical protein